MGMHRGLIAAALLSAVWIYPQHVNAQTPDVMRGMESLKKGSEAMKDHEPNAPVEIQTKSAAWRKLKPGMTEKEVTDILGKPDRVESRKESFRWYWEKAAPKGWVGFNNQSRKVTEWRNL